MIKRFLCWLFGHRTVFKATIGETITVDTHFEKDQKLPLMKWKRSKFCLRCGTMVHKD